MSLSFPVQRYAARYYTTLGVTKGKLIGCDPRDAISRAHKTCADGVSFVFLLNQNDHDAELAMGQILIRRTLGEFWTRRSLVNVHNVQGEEAAALETLALAIAIRKGWKQTRRR